MGEIYFVWSNEHRAWWGPDRRGYTPRISTAGRYRREEAIAICADAFGTSMQMGIPAELPVREEDVAEFIVAQYAQRAAP